MKRIWYGVLIIVLIISISILGYELFFSNSYIDEANKNMDINGLKLLMRENPKQDVLDKGLSFSPGGFGCSVYKSQNNDLQIIFSGFPDVLDEYVLINIQTSNPAYHFYSIGIGDPIGKAEDILIKREFAKQGNSSSKESMSFKKNKLSVSFLLNSKSEITKINISLSQTNKKNIIF